MTPFHLLVLSVAVYRLTRLVTADSISEPARESLRKRSHLTLVRSVGLEDSESMTVERKDRPISLWTWKLTACPWCISVWIAVVAIVAFFHWQQDTLYVAYVLACSVVAGILSERV